MNTKTKIQQYASYKRFPRSSRQTETKEAWRETFQANGNHKESRDSYTSITQNRLKIAKRDRGQTHQENVTILTTKQSNKKIVGDFNTVNSGSEQQYRPNGPNIHRTF